MTTPPTRPTIAETLALVGALLGLVLIILTGIIAAFVFIDDSEAPRSIATTLMSMLAVGVPAIITALVTGYNSRITRQTDRKVDDLLNGVMDEKIRRGVHTAMDERIPDAEQGD